MIYIPDKTANYSGDFEQTNTEYLSQTGANYGTVSNNTFTLGVQCRIESALNIRGILQKDNGSTRREFFLRYTSADKLQFVVFTTAETAQLLTTAPFGAASVPTPWRSIVAIFEWQNSTANSRIRLIVDGSEITAFDTRTNPTAAKAAFATVPYEIGKYSTTNTFDGLIYGACQFDSVKTYDDIFDSNNLMRDLTGLSGLHSWWRPQDVYNTDASDITNEEVLGTAWTDNNTVTVSTTVPK